MRAIHVLHGAMSADSPMMVLDGKYGPDTPDGPMTTPFILVLARGPELAAKVRAALEPLRARATDRRWRGHVEGTIEVGDDPVPPEERA